MFGLLGVVAAGLDFVLVGLQAATNTWFSPVGLLALSVALLGLHLLGVSDRVRRL